MPLPTSSARLPHLGHRIPLPCLGLRILSTTPNHHIPPPAPRLLDPAARPGHRSTPPSPSGHRTPPHPSHRSAVPRPGSHRSAVPRPWPPNHAAMGGTHILMDEHLIAKVADLGLSKLVSDSDKGHVSTQVKGTLGYLDPEYYMSQQLRDPPRRGPRPSTLAMSGGPAGSARSVMPRSTPEIGATRPTRPPTTAPTSTACPNLPVFFRTDAIFV